MTQPVRKELLDLINDITDNIVEESFRNVKADTSALYQGLQILPKRFVKRMVKRSFVELCRKHPMDATVLERYRTFYLMEITKFRDRPDTKKRAQDWGRGMNRSVELSDGNPLVFYALAEHISDRILNGPVGAWKDDELIDRELERYLGRFNSDPKLKKEISARSKASGKDHTPGARVLP